MLFNKERGETWEKSIYWNHTSSTMVAKVHCHNNLLI